MQAKVVWDVKYGENREIVIRGTIGNTRIYASSWLTTYEERFAPTIRYDALQIFLATAAKNGWKWVGEEEREQVKKTMKKKLQLHQQQ